MEKEKTKEDWEKEEWSGWKIVSEMLDNPDEHGIYPTSECYQKLYEFVVAQKKKAFAQQRQEIIEAVWDAGQVYSIHDSIGRIYHTLYRTQYRP